MTSGHAMPEACRPGALKLPEAQRRAAPPREDFSDIGFESDDNGLDTKSRCFLGQSMRAPISLTS